MRAFYDVKSFNDALRRFRGEDDLLTEDQAAALLFLKPRTLRLWRNNRGLPFIRISAKTIRYRRRDLNSWLDRHRVEMGMK